MTTIDTKHLRELAEAATPAEWWTTRDVRPHAVWAGTGSSEDLAICTTFARPDATYIASIDPPTLIALLDELERLRHWKAEAMQVHTEWEETWNAAGRPGRPGASKALGVRDEIERLKRAHSDASWGADMGRQGGA